MSEEILLTQEGFDKIVAEHDHLVAVGRKEVAEKLKEAISYGDLSENSEYDAAKNEQAELEVKILQLEDKIRKAKIIDGSEAANDQVSIGQNVKIKDMEDGDVMEFKIVGVSEADPVEGKISNDSPVGAALLGKKAGDVVEVQTPDGTREYTVMEIFK